MAQSTASAHAAAAGLAAAPKLTAESVLAGEGIELSTNGAVESQSDSQLKGVVVAPRMSRVDDDQQLRGGGLTIVTGCPLMTDDNWCRFRCCCCDQGCTKLVLMCQWYCIKCGPGGCQIEKNCPLVSNENFCRFKCICCDSGCRKAELVCQYLCIKCTV